MAAEINTEDLAVTVAYLQNEISRPELWKPDRLEAVARTTAQLAALIPGCQAKLGDHACLRKAGHDQTSVIGYEHLALVDGKHLYWHVEDIPGQLDEGAE